MRYGQGMTLRTVRPLIVYLRSIGVDVGALLAELHIEHDAIFDPAARISPEVMWTLWQRAEQLSGNPAIGLLCAEIADAAIGNVIPSEYLVFQLFIRSSTVGEAIDRVCRFAPLAYEVIGFERVTTGDRTAMVCTSSKPDIPAPLVEFCVGTFGRTLRQLAVDDLQLTIELRHGRRSDDAMYQRTLGGLPTFGAERDAIVLPTRQLVVPLRTAQPSVVGVLERRALEQLSQRSPDALVNDVRGILAAELETGNATIAHVSDKLQMSVRTVTRRLAAAGTSHRQLLDEVRRNRAQELLTDDGYTVTEIGQALGFAETSAFQRAFKRWTGMSPSAFRDSSRQS